MAILSYLLLSLCVCLVTSIKGVDFSTKASLQSLQCLVNQGYQFAIIRGSRSNTKVDANLYKNIENAIKAGMKIDIYIYPCVGRNATVQVYNMINNISTQIKSVERIWIDVEVDLAVSKVCDWATYKPQDNCLYIAEMINAIQSKGIKVGIYTNKIHWKNIFKEDFKECNVFKKHPLWYARYSKNSQNFNDFQSFGGWQTPHMKQHKGDVKICNLDVDLNWRP